MRCFLISGFEPFDGADQNSSQDLVQALHGRVVQGTTLQSCILPVACDDAWFLLKDQIKTYAPRAIIAFGQSNRVGIHLEEYAYNRNHFRIPDNSGNQPQDEAIVAGGKNSLRSSLPIEVLLSLTMGQEIPLVRSSNPGRFVCNNLFYHMQMYTKSLVPSGFVHLPFVCSGSLINGVEFLLKQLAVYMDSNELS